MHKGVPLRAQLGKRQMCIGRAARSVCTCSHHNRTLARKLLADNLKQPGKIARARGGQGDSAVT